MDRFLFFYFFNTTVQSYGSIEKLTLQCQNKKLKIMKTALRLLSTTFTERDDSNKTRLNWSLLALYILGSLLLALQLRSML